MHTKQMTVTPELAKQFLTQNTNNRSVRRSAVARHAQDMRAGNFLLMPHGIVILGDGTLADGQHRLMAIAECGIAQEMMVTFGAPKNCALNLDRGVGRTDYDNMRMTGVEWASLHTVAVLKMMISSPKHQSRGFSASQLVEIADDQIVDAIKIACESVPTAKKYLSIAPVKAAIALALIGSQNTSKQRIMDFGHVVLTGFSNGDCDSAAVFLRNTLMSQRGFTRCENDREKGLRLSQACLKAFLENKPMRRMPKHDELVWPKITLDSVGE